MTPIANKNELSLNFVTQKGDEKDSYSPAEFLNFGDNETRRELLIGKSEVPNKQSDSQKR